MTVVSKKGKLAFLNPVEISMSIGFVKLCLICMHVSSYLSSLLFLIQVGINYTENRFDISIILSMFTLQYQVQLLAKGQTLLSLNPVEIASMVNVSCHTSENRGQNSCLLSSPP